jgi:hypothetical protein
LCHTPGQIGKSQIRFDTRLSLSIAFKPPQKSSLRACFASGVDTFSIYKGLNHQPVPARKAKTRMKKTTPLAAKTLASPRGAAPLARAFGLLSGILLTAIAGPGCSMLTYTSLGGDHFYRCSLGSKTAIASLAVEAGTNGIRRVELQGYQNESSQALSAVTEAAVRAAITR